MNSLARIVCNPAVRPFVRAAAVASVVIITLLSLLPREHLTRTALRGWSEHAIAYAVCAGLAVVTYERLPRQCALAGTLILYAGLLEALQSLVPGRHPGFVDWAAGAGGVVVGTLCGWLVARSR